MTNDSDFEMRTSNRDVTAKGELTLLKRMLNVIGFRTLARSWNFEQSVSKCVYPPTQIIEHFIVSIWCDVNRFAHAEITRFILTFLQSRHINYIISAKLTHGLQ
jgi:hypothetical protein